MNRYCEYPQIEYCDGKYIVRDMQSDTGTFLKMVKSEVYKLECGDIFVAGNSECSVLGLEEENFGGFGCCSIL